MQGIYLGDDSGNPEVVGESQEECHGQRQDDPPGQVVDQEVQHSDGSRSEYRRHQVDPVAYVAHWEVCEQLANQDVQWVARGVGDAELVGRGAELGPVEAEEGGGQGDRVDHHRDGEGQGQLPSQSRPHSLQREGGGPCDQTRQVHTAPSPGAGAGMGSGGDTSGTVSSAGAPRSSGHSSPRAAR